VAAEFIPNPKQKLAIDHVHGPMLVLAGAGTGKTTVLVERIASLVKNGHARPEEILAITFTENAAQELKQRVEKRLGRRAAISASTFNAYCHAILKRSGKGFHILTPEDFHVFLRQRIHRLDLERFIKPADLGEFLHDLRSFFDRCHEELVEPKQFQEYVDSLDSATELPRNCKSKEVEALGPEEILGRWREIARVYSNAMRLLKEENLGTFGMQISGAVRLLQADQQLLHRERTRARFILIDEFQDCNSSNVILAELLGGDERNLFAVGDPDQAIYRFRGASSAAFEDFQRRFPETKGVSLEENQRSRSNILKVAYAAIRPNPAVTSQGRVKFERTLLQSGRDRRDAETGRLIFDDPVDVVLNGSERQEGADIADEILGLRRQMRSRERATMAVLYRSYIHRKRIVEELAVREIPFLVKGMDILDTPVIRDLLALVRAVGDGTDIESLFRVCAFPQFGMVAEQLRENLAVANNKSPFKSILQRTEGGDRVLSALQAARSFAEQHELSVSGTFSYLVKQFDFSDEDLAVAAMLRFVEDWEGKPFLREKTLAAFLEYLRFFEEAGFPVPMLSEEQMEQAARSNPDAVQLMTIHGAKGLEFSHVWVLRAISGSFPLPPRESLFEFPMALRSSIAMGESKEVHEQEERRLFYVAITRARDRLVLHSRPGRGQDPTPPGFLRSLLGDRQLGSALQRRSPKPLTAVPASPAGASAIGSWMLMAPAFTIADMALSAHSLDSYSTCPLKFKLERDWKIPGQAAAALQYGSAIHTVLKNYYDPQPHGLLQEVAEAEDLVAAFRREFAKAAIEDPLQRELYEEQGVRQLTELVRTRPRGSVEVIAAEARFQFQLGKVKIIGRMDRIDRVADSPSGNPVRIIDYKTGAARTQKFADESLQLSVYALGAAEMGFTARELVLLNVQGNQEVVTTRTPAQLDKTRRQIHDAAEGIAAQEFDPKPGLHCRWCDFERLCPATEQSVLIPVKALVAAKGIG
jgi:DNA helicase-2/ATP-dependent DNA helicase PcrA